MREEFIDMFLTESPRRIKSFPTFIFLIQELKEISEIYKPVDIGNGFFKILGNQIGFCWAEDPTNHDVIIVVKFEIKYIGYVVEMLGKNPDYKGMKPDAIQLYEKILIDSQKSLRIISDKVLTDLGFGVWRKFFDSDKFAMTVYKISSPGQTFETFKTYDEFASFFSDDKSSEDYQYVLTPKNGVMAETRCHFSTRRYRELAGAL